MALTVFLVAVTLVAAAYVGYPLWAWVRARLRPRPVRREAIWPRVSVVVTACDEGAVLGDKLACLAAQDYPPALLDVVVVVDGGDPLTVAAAEVGARALDGRARVVAVPRGGKPRALAAGVAATDGAILVFTDARQRLARDAVRLLVACFAGAEVGAVGGGLVLEGDAPAGAYWRYEAWLRRLEATAGSTVGVSGALWAVRRPLWSPLPPETVLDDVLAPMRVRLLGRRVAYEPRALAFDRAAASGREFRRKVRTLSGNYQLLLLEPRLLLPWRNPSWLDFVAHKLLRLLVPYALVAALVSAFFLPWPWSLLLGGGQLAGYALAAARALGWPLPLSGLAETFVVLNAAAVVALARVVRRGRALPWTG